MPILLAGKQLATPLPPVTLPIWTGTPAPSFTQGTASNYSFASLVTGGTSFASINAALPTGVTLNSGTEQLVYDGVGAVASVTGVVIRATNSNGSVDCLPFGFSIAAGTAFDFFIAPTTASPAGSDSNAGTLAAPWAITAINTKRATYAGKRVGIVDGTYDLTTMAATANSVKLQVASGTITNQTVIQGVNVRAAVLSVLRSSGGYVSAALIGDGASDTGSTDNPQYVTLKDLEITGGNTSAVSFAGASPATCPGIILDGLRVHDIVNPSNAVNIGCIGLGTGLTGAKVTNCLLYDCYTDPATGTARNQHGNSSGIHSYDANAVIDRCTIHSCNNGIYQKNHGGTPPPSGIEVKNSYFYYGAGMGPWVDGFNNATGVTPPYTAQSFHHNVVENCGPYSMDNSVPNFFQSPTAMYNNAYIWSASLTNGTGIGSICGPTTGAPWKFPSIYNNILKRITAAPDGERGDLTYGPAAGDFTVMDFNCWPSNATFGIGTDSTTIPASLVNLATHQGQSGTPDTHSITTDPKFVFQLTSLVLGGGTAQYQLQASVSPCLNAGRVGGVIGGAVIDMGPWQGSTQIGANFT